VAEKRCQCPGHWTAKLSHYVVTRRNKATEYLTGKEITSGYCEIKCRQCQRKWRSNAQYVEKLPDYEERKYKYLDDDLILQLIKEGRFKTNPQGDIFKQARQARMADRWLPKWERMEPFPDKNCGYLFVRLHYRGHRRAISVSRLVWMIIKQSLIPDECDVDHKDRDIKNNCPDNLRLLDKYTNRSRQHPDDDYVPF